MAATDYLIPELLDAITAAITAAWGAVTIVDDEDARLFQGTPDLPLVTLSWDTVNSGMGVFNAAVGEVNDGYSFEILYFFAIPAPTGQPAGFISHIKGTLASQIRATLQVGAGFPLVNPIVNMPIVTRAYAKEKSPRWEGTAIMGVTFTCQAASSHH